MTPGAGPRAREAAAAPEAPSPQPSLVRALGTLDGTLLTIGAIVGTGIFLTAGDVARAVPSAPMVLLVWLAGGLLVLAGALTYGELGTMFPRAGGLYHYLREAWGPVWGYLYGWSCLLVVMSGGIAAIAIGFGEYLGTFVAPLASERVVVSLGGWTVHGSQVSAVLAIVALTTVNHFGLRRGARVQNLLTTLKLAAIAVLVLAGLGVWGATGTAPAPAPAPAPGGAPLAAAFLTAMIATLWTYDGWYALTGSAGEMRRPERDLPRAIVAGVGVVIVVYLLANLAYLRTLPIETLASTPRVAEATAARLFGPAGARAMSAAVALSALGCLAATILYSSRTYQPMAADGLFFARVARIHPRWRTPTWSLWIQSAWAMVLALTGSYTALFTYVTFGTVLMHVLAGLAVFRLRVTRPEAPRPYRAWGYPVVPALFVAGMVALVVNTLQAAPRESLLGLLAIAAGLPLYAWWRRGPRTRIEHRAGSG